MSRLLKKILPRTVIRFGKNAVGSFRTKFKVRELLRSGQEIKLELGAGTREKNRAGWLSLDRDFGSDIYWDLSKPLPFPDGSISMIYSSHVLEHFVYRDLLRLLHDCHRVLKKDGIFSVCVPNGRIYIEGYLNPAQFNRDYLNYEPAVYSDKRMDIVNFIAHLDGEHRHIFDEENLIHILEIAGFKSAKERDFDPEIDLESRRFGSIYASAIKP